MTSAAQSGGGLVRDMVWIVIKLRVTTKCLLSWNAMHMRFKGRKYVCIIDIQLSSTQTGIYTRLRYWWYDINRIIVWYYCQTTQFKSLIFAGSWYVDRYYKRYRDNIRQCILLCAFTNELMTSSKSKGHVINKYMYHQTVTIKQNQKILWFTIIMIEVSYSRRILLKKRDPYDRKRVNLHTWDKTHMNCEYVPPLLHIICM